MTKKVTIVGLLPREFSLVVSKLPAASRHRLRHVKAGTMHPSHRAGDKVVLVSKFITHRDRELAVAAGADIITTTRGGISTIAAAVQEELK